MRVSRKGTRKTNGISKAFNSNRNATIRRRGSRGTIGRGGRWVRSRVAALGRKMQGKGRRGPRDHYIIPLNQTNNIAQPGLRAQTVFNVWGTGDHIANLLIAIRSEAISTLLGGAVLYQPTLFVSGYCELELLAAGVSPVHYELTVGTSNTNNAQSIAGTVSSFSTAWAQCFDARPTNYEIWPGTSMLENTAFWKKGALQTLKPTHYYQGRIEIGKAARIVMPFKTRRFNYNDYSSSTFLTSGVAAEKSFRGILHVWGEPAQNCGSDTINNLPILGELGTPYMMRVRSHYFYRWIAGNNRPTVYGDQYYTNESIPTDSYGWIGIPALRAQRGGANVKAAELTAGYPFFGALELERKHEANINPVMTCVGENQVPLVG